MDNFHYEITHKGKNEVVEVVKKLRTGFVDQSFHDGCVAEELVRKILLHIERHRTGTESRHIATCEQSEMMHFFYHNSFFYCFCKAKMNHTFSFASYLLSVNCPPSDM